MNKWIKWPATDPPLAENEIGWYPAYSKMVLIWNGTQVLVGYLQKWDPKDPDPELWPDSWKQYGRDGYSLNNVTHWQPLPEGPA